MKSYDILIDGEPYLFLGRGGMEPGAALLEPGTPRQLNTITIPSAHHGFGQKVARDSQQAEQLEGWEVLPGALVPAGDTTLLVTLANAFSGLSGSPDRQVASFVENDSLFILFPRKIIKVDGQLAVSEVLAAPVDFPAAGDHTAYTSAVKWRDKWIVGIESKPTAPEMGDASQRFGYKYAEYDIATDVWTNKVAGGDVATSHVAATSAAVFRMVNYGRHRPPELFIGDDPTVSWDSISWVGPIRVPLGGYCTALYSYGPHLFIFKRPGVVLALDAGQVLSPILTAPQQFVSDSFGFNTVQFLAVLVIPAKTILMSLDPNTLESINLSPGNVQGFLGDEAGSGLPGGIVVAAPTRMSNEIWAVTQGHGGEIIAISRGVMFKDGFHWTNQTIITGTRAAVGGSIFKLSSQGAFQYDAFQSDAFQSSSVSTIGESLIVSARDSDRTTGYVYAHKLYGEGFYPVPDSLVASNTYLSSRVSPDGAAAGLTVAPTQLRLWGAKGTSTSITVSLSVDEGTFSTLGTLSGTGPAAFAIPSGLTPRIGRTFRVRVAGSGLAGSTTRVDFPIALDYEFTPSTEDAISIRVEATSEQLNNLGGEWTRDSGRAIVDRLLALRGSTTTVGFPDGVQWTVLVREVASRMIEKESPTTNSPGWLVTLDCRRLA